MSVGPTAPGAAPARRGRLHLDPVELGLRLGLLALLLDASLPWMERVPRIAVAGLALVIPGAARSRWTWGVLLALTAVSLALHWPFSDNHDYLTAVFCLAVVAALTGPDADAVLATSTRWLLGLTFALAALWKLALAPEFLDGTFFRVALVTDGRFTDLAVLAGGVGYDAWHALDAAVDAALAGAPAPPGAPAALPPAIGRLAVALTAWTALAETAIALAFLWPPGGRISRARHGLLLLFAATTFAFATVRGFGWLLMVLGLCQCEPDRRRTALAYLGVFVLIEVHASVPWTRMLAESLGG